jgi:gamma-glutamyltranspeptidase / glutathione hydrolase
MGPKSLPPTRSRRRLQRMAACLSCAIGSALALWVCPEKSATAQRVPVEARHGLVTSASQLASRAGVDILKRGGNAIDAAVATAFTLAVTYPRAGNLGGGGFAVFRLSDGRVASIDFRETAPSAATRDLFLDPQGNLIPSKSTVGYAASGVPGTVAGLALAEQKYGSGRLAWADLLEPARRLAADGFAVSPALARDLQASAELLARFPESRRVFLRNGNPYPAGDRLYQPDLAATLRRLQQRGPHEFYTGRTARLIADDMAAHGGLITMADLAGYRAIERTPLHGSYRGYEILTMPPPSSGGVALLQMLGMLESHDVAALGLNSAAKIHLFAEVMRRAFHDRGQFLGDPDFVQVPVSEFLDHDYLNRRIADFDPVAATPNAALPVGGPEAIRDSKPPMGDMPTTHESTETTHLSVIDAAGNAVSLTYTLNGLWGSGVTVARAGLLLNNEMDDFAAKVGKPNMYGLVQGEANAIAPGKRPLSSMTPTIVLKDDKPFLITGSPGGPTIINTVLLVITNVIDHGLSVTQAVDAPRFHHQWLPDVITHEPFFTSPDSVSLLKGEGYALSVRTLYPNAPEAGALTWGDAETILIDPETGMRLGANDLRSADSAAVGW